MLAFRMRLNVGAFPGRLEGPCCLVAANRPRMCNDEGGIMLLPTPLAWIKKILAILKSDLSPNQIALAFALGIFAGLPPLGLHIILPFSIALLVRCSFRGFLISMGLFKLLSLVVAPVSYALGTWLLDPQRGLDVFWRWLVHLPVIAPMGYSQYILMGSLALALALAIPMFLLIRWLVKQYRAPVSQWVATWRVSRWLRDKRGSKWARKLLTGGEKKYEMPPSRKGIFRLVRREMLIGLPVIYSLAYLVAAVIVPFVAGTVVTQSATWATGTKVAVSDASFNLLTGNLTLANFSLQDPQAPQEDLIVIPEVRINAGMLPLVSNRVVFDSVAIADASLHVVREDDGTLNIDNPTAGWNVDGYIDWARRHAGSVDWLGLLRTLFGYLADWDPLAPHEDPYAAYAGGRTFPESRFPLTIKQLEIGRLHVTLEDDMAVESGGALPPMTMFEVELSNLAFPIALRTKPVQITLHGQWGEDEESGFWLLASLSSARGEGITTIEFAATRLDLPRLARFYATTLPVGVRSGQASLSGSIQFEGGAASGSLTVLLEAFELASTAAKPLFGLPEVTSERVIEGINRYAQEVPIVFAAGIEGTQQAPTIAWEGPLLEIAREGLMMAGRRELNRTILELGNRIEGLGELSTIPVDPDFQLLQDVAQSAARDVIEQAGGELLQGLPVPEIDGRATTEDGSSESLLEQVPGLLNQLLDTSSKNGDAESQASDPQ